MQSSSHELAQLNMARLLAPVESPQLSDFVANLDRINALAEQSPGFIWRLQTEAGNATAIRPFGDDLLINLSVWENVESLYRFVYRSDHIDIMRRRREWFDSMDEAYLVLWWVPAGHRPTLTEAENRFDRLKTQGATPQAFTFKEAFPPPGTSDDTARAG